ncbi:hypothetical protein [Actinokineospora sp. NBRC 105648]|uniref:hypothetical protein n=1 Tax=Actinokineospora sp. NBRC 105648 TaxID=3032206 RepID=UPI00249FF382|nr:hypothetical protein [Actinokineospora sp. NBRC 105648]GLZ42737.1 hypothetical protein Acsp05_63610 [Actinokineospora sp. NBRC 105648]
MTARHPVYADLTEVHVLAQVLHEAITDGDLNAEDLVAFEHACEDSLVRCRQLLRDPVTARAIALVPA